MNRVQKQPAVHAPTTAWELVQRDVLALVGPLDPLAADAPALEPLLARVAAHAAAWRVSVQVVDAQSGALRLAAGLGLEPRADRAGAAPRRRSVSRWVLDHGRGVVLHGAASDERFEGTGEAGLESTITVPLTCDGGTVGVASLARRAPAEPFTEADLAGLARALEPLGAILAARARARAQARPGVPPTLLPEGLTETARYEIAVARATALAPAFDVCDRVPHPDGSFTLLVADVAGRGAPAALAAGFLQGQFAAAASPSRSAAGLAAQIATAVAARFGPGATSGLWVAHFGRGGDTASCAAGHPAALWVPCEGDPIVALERGGPPPGAADPPRFEEERIRLLPGDLVVCASDGVLGTDDADPAGVSRASLEEWLAQHRRLPVDRIAAGVLALAARGSARAFPADDRLAIVVRYRPGA
uniref:GAF domain-containing protein n=1 Tax=Eiseniibacteriota bacterium TaxID=2212470 RepID=A0A832I3R8_UNCEI